MCDRDPPTTPRAARLIDLACWLMVVVLALRVAVPLLELVLSSDRLPQWDMAKYGVAGLRLARAVTDLDPLALVADIRRMRVFPPFVPLLEMPVFLIFGPAFAAPRSLVVVLYAAAVVAIFWTGRQLDREWGPAIGAAAAVLLAASPFAHVMACLVMLEVPGTLLLVLALGCAVRAFDSDRTPAFGAACALSTLLFFCKYNYGLMWLVPLLACEAWRRAGSLPAVARRALAAVGAVDLRRPLQLAVLAGCALAAALWLTGPWHVGPGSRRVEIASGGGIVWGLYLLVLLTLAARPRRSWSRLVRWWRGADARARTMALGIALPIAVWLLDPSHTRELLSFLRNRSSDMDPWRLDTLLYYPRTLATRYTAEPTVGVAAMILALIAVLLVARVRPAPRILPAALLVGALAVAIHPYKLPRFLFTVAPLVWLAAAWAAAAGLAVLARPIPAVARIGLARTVAAGVLAAGLAAPLVERQQLTHEVELRTVDPAAGPVLDAVVRLAATSPASVLLGHANQLSPGLVEWRAYQLRPDIRRAQVPRWIGPGGRGDGLVARLADQPTAPQLIVIDAEPGSWADRAGYSAETAWLGPIRGELAADRRFALEFEQGFANSGYVVRSYRRRP